MAYRDSPLGIYIHVPFCAARCGYCDFNTYVPEGPGQKSTFVEAALTELHRARDELGERRAATVFIGGGTPTLLGADELLRLLAGVGDTFGLVPGAEVTTEANPESVDARMLAALRRGGFTRMSIGMQSAARTCCARWTASTPPAGRWPRPCRRARPASSTSRWT
jgi:coproporphyrinogen III oxidase-like Fe-S oxidoreductase